MDAKYLIQPPADHRRRKAKLGELKSQAADRKPHLVQQVRKLDERAQYLYSTYGNRPNVKTIPYKKPAVIDNYEETESQNAPRKVILAARSSGKANPKNRPGDASNLGIYRKEANSNSNEGFKTMTNYNTDVDEVLAKVESLVDEGDYSSAEDLLNNNIAKYAEAIAKGKKKPLPPPAPTDDESDLGDEVDDETQLPVKAKKAFEDEEFAQVVAKAVDTLDADTDAVMRVAKVADAPGAHPLRKSALADTLSQLDTAINKLGGGGSYHPTVGDPVAYPAGQGEGVLQHNRTVSPGSTSQHPDRSQHTVLPAVVSPLPSAFEAKVTEIQTTRGLSRTAAQIRCRIENPNLYWAYVNGDAAEPTQAQQTRQRQYSVDKSAPTTSYDDLVNVEISKGHNPRVAAQRVAQLFGLLPNDSMAKAYDAADQWREAAQTIADRDGISATDALRKCRQERPALYRELQGRM